MNRIEGRKYYMRMLLISILGGVVVNVGLGFITHLFGLPLYLDTIGTIGVASVAGVLPALIVAVCTNVVCGFYNQATIYFSIISILIAIIEIILFVSPQFSLMARFSDYLTSNFIPNFNFNFIVSHILLDIFDKGLCVLVVVGVVGLLPDAKDEVRKVMEKYKD